MSGAQLSDLSQRWEAKECWEGGGLFLFYKGGHKKLTDKVTFEPRLSEMREWAMEISGGWCSRKWEQSVQRPWDRTVPCIFEEQRGGWCGWDEASERQSSRWHGQRCPRLTPTGPHGHVKGFGFDSWVRWGLSEGSEPRSYILKGSLWLLGWE